MRQILRAQRLWRTVKYGRLSQKVPLNQSLKRTSIVPHSLIWPNSSFYYFIGRSCLNFWTDRTDWSIDQLACLHWLFQWIVSAPHWKHACFDHVNRELITLIKIMVILYYYKWGPEHTTVEGVFEGLDGHYPYSTWRDGTTLPLHGHTQNKGVGPSGRAKGWIGLGAKNT